MQTAALDLRNFNRLVAVKMPTGRILGFHTTNMEVAELSPESWEQMQSMPSVESEAGRSLIEWDQFENPNARQERTKSGQIRSITINVTQVCNLACTYCAAGGDGTYGDPVKKISVDKTIPQLRMLMERAEGSFQITFLGGEPLLYPDGIKILADVAKQIATERNLKLRLGIVTNGTLFTESNIQLLAEMKASVNLSLDGDKETNDQRRPTKGGRGVTDKVVEGLNALLRRREELTEVGISGVFGRGNLDLMRAWDFFRQFNLDYYDFVYDHHEKEAEPSREFTQALVQVGKRAFEIGGEDELRKIKTYANYFHLLDEQLRLENFCGAGKSFLQIDARNQVTTCPWLVGEAKEIVGVGTTIFQDRLEKLQEPLIQKNNCGDCWARFLCGGGCMYIHRNKTGHKHQVDPNFCERTRSLIGSALELYLMARSDNNSNDSEGKSA